MADRIVPSGSRAVTSVGMASWAARTRWIGAWTWWATRTRSFCANWKATTANVVADRVNPSMTMSVERSRTCSGYLRLARGRNMRCRATWFRTACRRSTSPSSRPAGEVSPLGGEAGEELLMDAGNGAELAAHVQLVAVRHHDPRAEEVSGNGGLPGLVDGAVQKHPCQPDPGIVLRIVPLVQHQEVSADDQLIPQQRDGLHVST